MKLPLLLFLFFPLFCFSQKMSNNIDTDTILINSHLKEKTIFLLDTISCGKSLCAWFSFVNDSEKNIFIDRISTGDGGTYAKCDGKTFNGKTLAANDTLTFCIYFVVQQMQRCHNREIQILSIDPKDQSMKALVQFKLLLYVKE
jgi:hypothetical protein